MRILALLALLVPAIAQAGGKAMTLAIASPAFAHMEEIPARYTCEGGDRSPPLQITAEVPGAKTLALLVDDPDAPDPNAPRMIWTHWIAYNLPARTQTLAEGVGNGAPPEGAAYGRNDWGRTDYGGPCPPIGRHRYFFRLYALDTELSFAAPPTRGELLAAIRGHVLAEAELVGTYEKRGR